MSKELTKEDFVKLPNWAKIVFAGRCARILNSLALAQGEPMLETQKEAAAEIERWGKDVGIRQAHENWQSVKASKLPFNPIWTDAAKKDETITGFKTILGSQKSTRAQAILAALDVATAPFGEPAAEALIEAYQACGVASGNVWHFRDLARESYDRMTDPEEEKPPPAGNRDPSFFE